MAEQLTYVRLTDEQLHKVNEIDLLRKDAVDVLKWAYNHFNDNIVYACSLGAEGIVLVDLISKVRSDAKIIFLDTDFHFKETYELFEKVKKKYPKLQLEMIKPDVTVAEQVQEYGDHLWSTNPDLCCQLRKIKPLEKELAKYDAWISGLRREQSPTRKNTQFVNRDNLFKSIKICPLIHWTWDEVWLYIKLHELTYNELHDRNYPSIGCENCTLPVTDNSDSRTGRWSGKGKTECGLHG